jgi:hypothetical protein
MYRDDQECLKPEGYDELCGKNHVESQPQECDNCGGKTVTPCLCPTCANKRIAYLEKALDVRDMAAWDSEDPHCRYCERGEDEECEDWCPTVEYPKEGGKDGR